MRNIFVCLMLLCGFCEGGLLQGRKIDMLEKAEYHRVRLQQELIAAERMLNLIPDLGDRQHLKALITGAFAAAPAGDARVRIFTVGAALLTSLAIECYEKWEAYCHCLGMAEYHGEMYAFYAGLSLHMPGTAEDEGTRHFLDALDHVVMCEVLAMQIQDEDMRGLLSGIFVDYRKMLVKMSDMDKAPAALWTFANAFSENVGEILAECEDSWAREELEVYSYAAAEDVEQACRCWGVTVGGERFGVKLASLVKKGEEYIVRQK